MRQSFAEMVKNLPQDIVDLIDGFLRDNRGNVRCFCGSTTFIVADVVGYSSIQFSPQIPGLDPYLADQAKFAAVPSGKTLPVLPLVCTECGLLRQYALATIIRAAKKTVAQT